MSINPIPVGRFNSLDSYLSGPLSEQHGITSLWNKRKNLYTTHIKLKKTVSKISNIKYDCAGFHMT